MGPPARPRKPGGRRPKEEECKLPPEEEEKRRLRRIRNKEAAARCRKRRLDQMQTLEMVYQTDYFMFQIIFSSFLIKFC